MPEVLGYAPVGEGGHVRLGGEWRATAIAACLAGQPV